MRVRLQFGGLRHCNYDRWCSRCSHVAPCVRPDYGLDIPCCCVISGLYSRWSASSRATEMDLEGQSCLARFRELEIYRLYLRASPVWILLVLPIVHLFIVVHSKGFAFPSKCSLALTCLWYHISGDTCLKRWAHLHRVDQDKTFILKRNGRVGFRDRSGISGSKYL